MGIHVNIGEAKTRLSQLIAAAERGEDVMIAGVPAVRITPINANAAKLERAAKRRAFIGEMKSAPPIDAVYWLAPMSNEDLKLWLDGPLLNERDAPSN